MGKREALIQVSIEGNLGSDQYGMREYAFVLLKKGIDRVDSLKEEELQKRHLQLMRKLMLSGTLLFQAPILNLENSKGPRGILIFDSTLNEVEDLLKDDPYIKEGILEFELYTIYGSGGLLKVPEIHQLIEQKSFSDYQ